MIISKKPVYYDLDKIPPHRQHAITKALKYFKKTYGLKSCPIDCVQLILKMQKSGPIKIYVKSTTDLPSGKLARTFYLRPTALHLVSINLNQLYDGKRYKYPFIFSSDRMLNFTIAHEIGHMALNHFDIEDQNKDTETTKQEEIEANEFAGRLLMPEELVLTCSYKSHAKVAEYFMVSEQALLKRLSQLNQHDKRFSKPFPVCQNCGNSSIKDNDNYCPICGIPLVDNKGGVITMEYFDGLTLDNDGRTIPCPRCGNTVYGEDDKHCKICGLYLCNSCTFDYCQIDEIHDCSARYCGKCGSSTSFLTNGLLKDWSPSREAHFNIKEFEEDLCAPGTQPKVIESHDWSLFLIRLSTDNHSLLADALGSCHAKICGKTVLIFLRESYIKNRIDKPKYLELLLTCLQDYLGLDVEEVKLAAYEEFLPEPEPIEDSEIPF